MKQKAERKRSVLNYSISFVLLYVTILIAVFAMQSLKKIESQRFLFVTLAKVREEKEQSLCVPTQRENSIVVKKIGVDAPLVFPLKGDSDLLDDLDKGVTHFPDSVLPGEEGAAMFLGHSAPPGWPDVNYDKVFIHIDQLEKGDEIEVYYDNCRYEYQVFDKEVLDKGQEVPDRLTIGKKYTIMLISCWPPATGTRRMVVAAELELPSF